MGQVQSDSVPELHQDKTQKPPRPPVLSPKQPPTAECKDPWKDPGMSPLFPPFAL